MGRHYPAFRHLFTSRFMPDATEQQVEWFSDLCRKTTSPEIAGELLETKPYLYKRPLAARDDANSCSLCPQ